MKLRKLNSLAATLALCAAIAGPAVADGIFPDTQSVTASFTDAAELEGTRMTPAWDSTNYWSSSGGGATGLRLAHYASDGPLLDTYAPGFDFRSVFTNPDRGAFTREHSTTRKSMSKLRRAFLGMMSSCQAALSMLKAVCHSPQAATNSLQ
ncbi:MAG: hypothetical protein ACR2HJ_01350 [Fimbriimonadales bacterium]